MSRLLRIKRDMGYFVRVHPRVCVLWRITARSAYAGALVEGYRRYIGLGLVRTDILLICIGECGCNVLAYIAYLIDTGIYRPLRIEVT